ncbi:MAG: 30S ribosomal protein S1 [Candidatus Pelagibacter sp.]|nr:30S ribosomal protein S1 [Candidatus Pelagibacter sp.]|tara:strand:+ start:5513 stop:7246 length:1734 start_codon:yes stop_codon:yes gene_type:complete
MEIKTEPIKKENSKEFENLLKEDFKKRDLKEGNIIKAKVSEIGKKFIFLDLKAKSEAILPIEELKLLKELEGLKVGSNIEVYLERLEGHNGEVVVSRQKAKQMDSWKRMEKAFETQEEVEGLITNKVKGGMVVNVDSCLCFLPGSQISTTPLKNYEIDKLMNVPLKFLVVKCDKIRGNLVVSRRAILEKSKNEDIKKILSKIKEGDIVEGKVKAIVDWGAFIDISGADALLHCTDLSYSRVKKTSDLLSIGQSLKVKIIKIDQETKRISCGIKQMHADPYENLEKKYKINQTYKGVVTKCVDYGVFVKLEEGLEGLVHQSELSWVKKNIQPSKILSPSQEIEVKIIEVDTQKKRVSLSYKQTQENPWSSFSEKSPVGSLLKCKIINITDFGLFVSLENSGLIGMIHYKDISWKEDEESLKNFKKNDFVKAKLLEVDKEKEKIRLGIKQLEKDPFDFFNNKKNGEVVTAVVKNVLRNGIKVSVGPDENSLFMIKKSDLAKDIENCRPEIFTMGNKVDCMIVGLDQEKRKVSLSIKELEIQNEKIAIKKYGKDGTSSGQMLGDILGKVLGSKKKKKDKE